MKHLKIFSQSSNISSYSLKMILLLLLIGIIALAAVKYAGDDHHSGQELNITENSTVSISAVDLCENFTGIAKAWCYLDDNNLNAPLNVCKNLNDTAKDECYGRLALSIAEINITTALNICKNSSDYYTCGTNVIASIAQDNITYAWYLCNEKVGHAMCNNLVVRIALIKNESLAKKLCNTYEWWYDKCQCYDTIFNIFAKKNISDEVEKESKLINLCGEMPIKCTSDCKIKVADMVVSRDYEKAVKICENVSWQSREVCYLHIVSDVNKFNRTLSIDICKRISHKYERDSCFNIISYKDH